MKLTLRLPAEAPNVRYAPGAFDGWPGRSIPIYGTGVASSTGEVVSAEVVEDGAAVELTLEVADHLGQRISAAPPNWVLGPLIDAIVLRPSASSQEGQS